MKAFLLSPMKKLLLLLGAAVVLLAGFMLVRTTRYGSEPSAVEREPPTIAYGST